MTSPQYELLLLNAVGSVLIWVLGFVCLSLEYATRRRLDSMTLFICITVMGGSGFIGVTVLGGSPRGIGEGQEALARMFVLLGRAAVIAFLLGHAAYRWRIWRRMWKWRRRKRP